MLNPMMKGTFGWGEEAMQEAAKEMLERGQYGLDRFIKFLRFFVMNHGLKGVMFESKLKVLLEELERQYVAKSSHVFPEADTLSINNRYPSHMTNARVPDLPEVIDVDQHEPQELKKGRDMGQTIPIHSCCMSCAGIVVPFLPGKNHHTSYPFGLYNSQNIPWNYHSVNDLFYIQARTSLGVVVRGSEEVACNDC